ncbi:MAG: prepilin-type N-terminal cleavage/methylation domain-containing protein [Acidimicrobiales bacterium]
MTRPPGRGRGPDDGFSMIELVVALAILAFVMSASLASIMQGLQLSRDNQDRVVASTVVSGVMQKLRTLSLTQAGFAGIPVTTETLPSQTLQNVTYTLIQTTEWVARGVDGSVCNTATNTSLILRATVAAHWNAYGSVTSSTLIAPPTGTFSPDNGSLAVQLTSSTPGQGFSGASVVAVDSGGTSHTITTGSDGCAFFAQLPQGNTVITISSAGGVDEQENSPSHQTASITAGQVSTIGINFDEGGTVQWSYPATPPPATDMPLSLGNPSQKLNDNMYPTPGGVGTSGSIYPIYPDTYDIFAGGCTDADPNGLNKSGTDFYSSSTYPNLATGVTVTPGGSTPVTVPLYPLNLQILSGGAPATTANSPTNPVNDPTAVAGAPSLSGGGSCPDGSPTYGLTAVTNGTSSTGVGLGHLAINVAVLVGTTLMHGSVDVWVMPDGVYNVDANGNATTEIYSDTSGGAVPVPVS